MKENLVGLLVLLFQDCRGPHEVRAPRVLRDSDMLLTALLQCSRCSGGHSLPQRGGASGLSAGCSGLPATDPDPQLAAPHLPRRSSLPSLPAWVHPPASAGLCQKPCHRGGPS